MDQSRVSKPASLPPINQPPTELPASPPTTPIVPRTTTSTSAPARKRLKPQPTGQVVQTTKKCNNCYININSAWPDPQPLALENGGPDDRPELRLPDSDSTITILLNNSIRFLCAGTSNFFTALGPGIQDIQAICVGDNTFSVFENNYEFPLLKCEEEPVPTAVRSEVSCDNGNSMVNIGFEVSSDFITVIEVCLSGTNVPLWSKYDLVAGIANKQTSSRLKFNPGSFYLGVDPEFQYRKDTQKKTFAYLLDSTELETAELFSKGYNYFLAKGHLTPKPDFVYRPQQQATFYFINAAPQWQTFNNGNWRTVENSVRKLADGRPRGQDLIVYTGTLGKATYANDDKIQTPMYLHPETNNNNQLPVPAVFWKIVYDPKAHLATAIVGINNPHLKKEDVKKDKLYWFCEDDTEDVSGEISWLTWKKDIKDNQEKGICYCCKVDKITSKVSSLPDFGDEIGLLK